MITLVFFRMPEQVPARSNKCTVGSPAIVAFFAEMLNPAVPGIGGNAPALCAKRPNQVRVYKNPSGGQRVIQITVEAGFFLQGKVMLGE